MDYMDFIVDTVSPTIEARIEKKIKENFKDYKKHKIISSNPEERTWQIHAVNG